MSTLTHSPISPWNPTLLDGAAHAPSSAEETWPSSRSLRTGWPRADGRRFLVKRAVDLAGASAGLLLLAPVMLAIALLIRLDSPGPVLFRQVRRGYRGRPFRMLKFRTMLADAESRLGDLESCNE
jgi:lipopolysaccharide/colanic/teichoic acid biosynthesis glycosyltransferase